MTMGTDVCIIMAYDNKLDLSLLYKQLQYSIYYKIYM